MEEVLVAPIAAHEEGRVLLLHLAALSEPGLRSLSFSQPYLASIKSTGPAPLQLANASFFRLESLSLENVDCAYILRILDALYRISKLEYLHVVPVPAIDNRTLGELFSSIARVMSLTSSSSPTG